MKVIRICFICLVFVLFGASLYAGDIKAAQREPQSWDFSGDAFFWNVNSLSEEQIELLKRPEYVDKKLSVIIPCYYKHASKLFSLLRMYEAQTRLPDEVVISLSDAGRVDPNVLEQLRQELWAFPVTIVLANGSQAPGINRNIACKHAIGDIFMCQDADDIPHPQRVEVIHYFFTTYHVDHLMHGYKRLMPEDSIIPFKPYDDLSLVQFACLKNFDDVYYARLFHNGNVAIARQTFDVVKWPGIRLGEDTEFNKMVYKKFNNCIVIRAIIFAYREFLSSTAKVDVKENQLTVNMLATIQREKRYNTKFIKS